MCGPRCRVGLARTLLTAALVACVVLTAGAPARALVQNELGVLQDVATSSTDTLTGVGGVVGGTVEGALEGTVEGVVGGAVEGVEAAVEPAISAVAETVQGVVDFTGGQLPEALPGVTDAATSVLPPGDVPSVLPDGRGLLRVQGGDVDAQPVPERVLAIIVCHPDATAVTMEALSKLGISRGVEFQQLPMLAVPVDGRQLSALRRLPGVRAVFLDRPLQYYLNESAPAIGASAVWQDLGFTGRGVTMAVVDTGVDASHPDLQYGSKTVENVKVLAGPSLLEDQGPEVFLPPVYVGKRSISRAGGQKSLWLKGTA